MVEVDLFAEETIVLIVLVFGLGEVGVWDARTFAEVDIFDVEEERPICDIATVAVTQSQNT